MEKSYIRVYAQVGCSLVFQPPSKLEASFLFMSSHLLTATSRSNSSFRPRFNPGWTLLVNARISIASYSFSEFQYGDPYIALFSAKLMVFSAALQEGFIL